MTCRYTFIDSPLGNLWVAWSEAGLVSVGYRNQDRGARIDPAWRHDPRLDCPAITQLGEYFTGRRRAFDLPLAPVGTDFQKAVWRALTETPFGRTMTYGELAHRLGRPSAARAVGAANGMNPIAIIVPCHRVIGADGRLTGYAGGLDIKRKLLELEAALVGDGEVVTGEAIVGGSISG